MASHRTASGRPSRDIVAWTGRYHCPSFHGLADVAQVLPHCEAHFVPGGHFVAITISAQIMTRLRRLLDDSRADASSPETATA